MNIVKRIVNLLKDGNSREMKWMESEGTCNETTENSLVIRRLSSILQLLFGVYYTTGAGRGNGVVRRE